MKENFLILLIILFVSSLLINFQHLRRDPPEVLVGILTNMFASCIVIQKGSRFYKKSSITSSILYIIGLFFLCTLVGVGYNTCPESARNRHAPILHCFQGNFVSSNFTMKSCQWPDELNSTCIDSFHNLQADDYASLNCTSVLTIGPGRGTISVTFCENMPWWLPLITACGILTFLHIVSILLIQNVLTKMLDSIHVFKISKAFLDSTIVRMSKKCCPASSVYEPILNQNEKYYMEDISQFLDRPTRSYAEELNKELNNKTGLGLISLAIKNDYLEVIRVIVEKLNVPVNREMLTEATKEGSPEMLKFLLRSKKEYLKGKHGKLILYR